MLDQLDRIPDAAAVPATIAATRAAGQRVFGFGSRAYAGEDLRPSLMRDEWLAIGGDAGRRADAIEIERAIVTELARIGRPLQANVDYCAALLLEACGLPRSAFTPFFAAARSAGWMGHAAEQRAKGRMIRPVSHYAGIGLT